MSKQLTTKPMVTGGSVLGLKYSDGVLLCSDTLCSYGSLALFKEVSRIAAIGTSTVIAASGEFSDFQEIVRLLRQKQTEDFIQHDGVQLNAKHYASYLSSLMYSKRNKGDPLYNSVLVAGIVNSEPYLAYIDLYGTHVLADFNVTGFAHHISKPIIANEWKPGMSEQEARTLLEKGLRVLWYRDARASDRVQFARVTNQGVEIDDGYKLESEWENESFKIYARNPLFPY